MIIAVCIIVSVRTFSQFTLVGKDPIETKFISHSMAIDNVNEIKETTPTTTTALNTSPIADLLWV